MKILKNGSIEINEKESDLIRKGAAFLVKELGEIALDMETIRGKECFEMSDLKEKLETMKDRLDLERQNEVVSQDELDLAISSLRLLGDKALNCACDERHLSALSLPENEFYHDIHCRAEVLIMLLEQERLL